MNHTPAPDAVKALIDKIIAIIVAQPYYPDTNIGMRQQWVKDQIIEKIKALPAPDAVAAEPVAEGDVYDPDAEDAHGNVPFDRQINEEDVDTKVRDK